MSDDLIIPTFLDRRAEQPHDEIARCSKCGATAEFGYKIHGGPAVEWFCAEHRLSQNYADVRLPKLTESKQATDDGEVDELAQDAKAMLDELAQHAEAIRVLGKRVVADIIEIGRHLTEAKELCAHGQWLPWLEREFNWSQSTADRFIQVYRKRDELPTRGYFEFPLSAQYLLAAPNTPQEVRQDIKDRVESGERVTAAQVKDTIAKAKKAKKAKKPPSNTPDPRPNVQHKQIAAGLTLARQMSLATLDQFIAGLKQLRREKAKRA